MLDELHVLLHRDPFLLQDAQRLKFASNWYELQGDEKVVWGGYRSSKTEARVMLDLRLEKPAFQCSCKSRKNPCRHILAVLLLLLESSERIQVSHEPPDDVMVWLQKRSNRLIPKTRTEEEEAQLAVQRNKTRAVRLQQMSSGLDDLERWLHDIIKEGLATLYHRPPTYWKEWSAQLHNAKMGNLAKRIEQIPILFSTEDWHEVLLAELGDLYLIIRGFRQLEQLPEGLQHELFNSIGVNVKRNDLLELDAVNDHWIIVAQREGIEDKLRFQRTWLYGKKTEQYALLLEYAWGDTPFAYTWNIGKTLEAAFIFYPAQFLQRAICKTFQYAPEDSSDLPTYSNFSSFQSAYTKAIAKNPWLTVFPAAVAQLIPVVKDNQLHLLDSSHQCLALKAVPENTMWQLIALSGGHPIHIFGEWEKGNWTILAAKSDTNWVNFESTGS